jgi:hypothetical protein
MDLVIRDCRDPLQPDSQIPYGSGVLGHRQHLHPDVAGVLDGQVYQVEAALVTDFRGFLSPTRIRMQALIPLPDLIEKALQDFFKKKIWSPYKCPTGCRKLEPAMITKTATVHLNPSPLRNS